MQEIVVLNKVRNVQVVDWELYQVVQLSPRITHFLKSLKLDRQNRRWPESLEGFLVRLVVLTFRAENLVG